MHSPRNPTPSPTYELSFPLGGDLLKLFMFDTRFFIRDASLSLFLSLSPDIYTYILYTNLHHSFIFDFITFLLSHLHFSPLRGRVDNFSLERDEVLFVDLMARIRFGRNVFTGV